MNQEPNKAQPLIEAAVQNLRTILNEQLVLLEESLRSSSGDVHAMVAERKSLVRKLKLDQKLTEIWEEVKYYPGVAKQKDSLKYRLCEIDDPKAEKRDKEHDISFLLNGHSYTFTYLDKGGMTGFDGDYFHHTNLSLRDASNSLLIEINISVERDDYGSVLKPFEVMGFIPGAWIQDFLECYEKFQTNKKIRDIKKKYDSGKMAELKNRFGLE
jgi:hypothetical protein